MVSFWCQAQCDNRTELLALANSSFFQPPAIQTTIISSVLSNWNRCHYLEDSSYVNLMLERAKARSLTRDFKTAIQEIEQTLRLYAKPHSYLKAEDQVKACYRLGFYWKELNEFEKAIAASEQAVKLGEHLPASKWISFAYSTLAYAHYSAGEYQKAVEYAERGMYQARRANNEIAYLENYGEKIKVLIALGRNKEADKELSHAITIAQNNPDASYELTIFLVRKAKVEEYNLDIKNALIHYREALKINISKNNNKVVVDNYNDIGFLFYNGKKYDEALKNYQSALIMAFDPYTKLRLLDNIGMVYWQKKQYITAHSYYQMALASIDPRFSKHPIIDLPDAKLVRISSQKEFVFSLIQDKADTWLDYAKATNNRQRFQYALATYKVADQMIDYMRWEHTGNLSKLYWREKTRGLYERAIETCYRLNDTVQAFRFFEKSRAVMLADKLNELSARQKLTQTQVNKENELRRAVNDQQAKLSDMSPDRDSYKSARMELFAKQEKLDAFLKQLEISNPDYYRYKYDTTITALADLRSRLNTRKASFVTYFVGDSALYVLGITADGTRLLRRPVSGYQQAMNEFMTLLWKPEAMNRKANFGKFLKSGYGLYQRLLAPLNLPAGRVIVSPDGSFVPFETLSRKATTPDYLVDNYAFSYNYSARLWLKKIGSNPPRHSFTQLDFLGVAPVDFAPSLKQVMLPGSDTALAAIARRFKSSKLLTHGYATRQAFLTQAVDARVIHLFTHATADSSDQHEPKLYFADSVLALTELSDRTLPNTQLVVLAACKTGIGANQRGEGVFSLARGFAALGVPSVLTTLWSVQNDATYQLTNLFYKHLDEGLPKDIALQLAKKEWIETAGGANRLPNYWAGLIIVGDAEPLPDLHLAWWGSFLAVLLMAAAVIVWYEFRKSRITQAVSLPQPA